MSEPHQPEPPEQGIGEPQPPQNSLTPLNIIRTETVLSKLPIHNLAKKGTISIHIVRTNDAGKVDLLWKVSPSRDVGEPRQLAYKLDTIIINHRIEEQGRPLPELIRLGSLREIARELVLGADTATVKKALHQNAGAYITAKLAYRSTDGTEQHLEAGFTRYSVIFTGEKLPNGKKADAVYIELHPRYREVLNNAPVRPLNYDYLKELPPAAQRFYEIVSYRIYAALKYQQPEAKLSYAEYCTYSAQQRYLDYDHFKKQMYKVHRPHLKSGYLATVRYEEASDPHGQPDWTMFYTPGPKACAEYDTFTGKVLPRSSAPPPEPQKQPVQPQNMDPRLAELTNRGISEKHASDMLARIDSDQPLADQLEWGDYLIAQAGPGKYRNPAGFYIHLIRENIMPPDTFESSRKKALREQAHRAREQEKQELARLELAYEDYKRQEIDRYIAENCPEDRFQGLLQGKIQELRGKYKMFSAWKEEDLVRLANAGVRADLARMIAFTNFETFCRQERERSSQPPSPEQGIGETPASSEVPTTPFVV